MTHKRLQIQTTDGVPASDGAGVRMTRVIGNSQFDHIDPFLLLDVFKSDNPDDYIAGFPSHPHRGFETVTYMFAGQMRHKDNAGNEGVIEAGGVQWMTAGRGIVHSEMPEQQDGLMWGTQLWVNLPASDKMTEPGYQEFAAADIPQEERAGDVSVRVIAGTTGNGTEGAVRDRPTEPMYFDVSLPAGANFVETIPESHNAILFVVEGAVRIDDTDVAASSTAILNGLSAINVAGSESPSRFLLIAARRLQEPIARGGPFVMNTEQELRQAFHDYQTGNF